jgi:hypothetical protein
MNCIIMATKYIQNEYDLHLFVLYKLINPINCNIWPNTFSNGTTSVKGTENDDRIEVIVDI